MRINLKLENSDEIVENFVKNILQKDNLEDGQIPPVFDILKYFDEMGWQTIRNHIFNMLLQYRLFKIAKAKVDEETALADLIHIIAEEMEEIKKEKYIEKYSIHYQFHDHPKYTEELTIFYSREKYTYSILLNL